MVFKFLADVFFLKHQSVFFIGAEAKLVTGASTGNLTQDGEATTLYNLQIPYNCIFIPGVYSFTACHSLQLSRSKFHQGAVSENSIRQPTEHLARFPDHVCNGSIATTGA